MAGWQQQHNLKRNLTFLKKVYLLREKMKEIFKEITKNSSD